MGLALQGSWSCSNAWYLLTCKPLFLLQKWMHVRYVLHARYVRYGVHNTRHPVEYHNWILLPHHQRQFLSQQHLLQSGSPHVRSGMLSWHGHAVPASYRREAPLPYNRGSLTPRKAHLPFSWYYRIRGKALDCSNLTVLSGLRSCPCVWHHNNTARYLARSVLFLPP